MLRTMRKAIIIFLSIVALLTSCTVTESINITGSQKGSSSSDILVEDFFIEVLEDFGEFLPTSDKSIMDEAMEGFAGQLQSSSASSGVKFRNLGDNHYTLDFSYLNMTKMMKDLGAADNTLIRETPNSFSFYVDINNFEELTKIVPFLADPNFEVYGPVYNQGMTEEEYLDMIYFLLGEDGPDAIKNGKVTINIEVPGNIKSLTGAVKTGNKTAQFKFPIIDFLLLNKPITFSVSW